MSARWCRARAASGLLVLLSAAVLASADPASNTPSLAGCYTDPPAPADDAAVGAAQLLRDQRCFLAHLGELGLLPNGSNPAGSNPSAAANNPTTSLASGLLRPASPRRGVVYAAGGADRVANALIGATHLRRVLRSVLPIEVIYFGASEMPAHTAKLLTAPGLQPLRLVDSSQVPYPPHHRPAQIAGFAAKVWALFAATSFDEVLLLDADSFPLLPPERLFRLPEFRSSGNLFFPDFWVSNWNSRALYTMFGAEPPWLADVTFHSTESGQLLLDRRRFATVLEWVWFLNSHHTFLYKRHCHGDKDLFRLAFHLAGQAAEFTQAHVHPAILLKDLPSNENRYKMVGVLQYTPDGRPAFSHLLKYFPDVAWQRHLNISRPEWVMPGATQARAWRTWKPHEFALNAAEVNTEAWRQCRGGHREGLGGGGGLQPPAWDRVGELMAACGLGQEEWGTPMPVLPLSSLPIAEAGLHSLDAVFRRVRAQLGGGRRAG